MTQTHQPPYSNELLQLINRKSSLLLRAEAELAQPKSNGSETAKRMFAEAAELELAIFARRQQEGHIQRLYLTLVSAASCYLSAGSFADALQLFEQILKRDDLPPTMRVEAKSLMQKCEVAMVQKG